MHTTLPSPERKSLAIDSTTFAPQHRRWFLKTLLGAEVVIVALKKGTKKNLKRGDLSQYRKLMSDAAYLRLLDSPDVDLGILCGPDSSGVCAIDLDGPEAVKLWDSQVAPSLVSLPSTVLVKSKNGIKHFFTISGDYPAKVVSFGEKDGVRYGEFRGGNCVTKVMGTHPDGGPYIIEFTGSGGAPFISLDQIEFPNEFNFPPPPEEPVLYLKSGSGVHLDHWEIAKTVTSVHPIAYDSVPGTFFKWSETSMTYQKVALPQISKLAADFLGELSAKASEPGLRVRRSSGEVNSIINALKGEAGMSVVELSRQSQAKFFPAANCDIDIVSGEVHTPTPDRPFLHRSVVPYVRDLDCPRFKEWIVEMFPEDGALRLLHLYCGQILIGANVAKKILAVSGPSNTGKSTFIRLIQKVVGGNSFAELRTTHLNKRFELGSFMGRTTLVAQDAPLNFLLHDGAQQLKSLTGGDEKSVEFKNENGHEKIPGNFNIVLTSNSPLSIATFGDPSAFLERIVPLSAQPFSGEMVAGFDDFLIREEGVGLLNWMLGGAREIMASPCPARLFTLGEKRQRALMERLDVPGLIHQFVKEMLVPDPAGEVQLQTLLQAFQNWQGAIGVEEIEVSPDAFGRHLRAALVASSQLAKHRKMMVSKNGERHRGYTGLAIRAVDHLITSNSF